MMRANDVHDHFRSLGTWVDWDKTCDAFLHGRLDAEVHGIACAWIPTMDALREAGRRGANLFVTHEPAFYPAYADKPAGVKAAGAKRQLLDELGMTMLRCHDVWDRVAGHGITDSWASFLGFPVLPVDESGLADCTEADRSRAKTFYRRLDVSGHTVDSLARAVLDRVRTIGQDSVGVYGDGARPVKNLLVGTGCIAKLPTMAQLGGDVLLGTDDGMTTWDSGLWAVDTGTPVIMVSHATSEIPGMMSMAGYLSRQFPGVPSFYVPIAMPHRTVGG
jgi:putative NIF3 family GTP cyclohydrolase 1 type 2